MSDMDHVNGEIAGHFGRIGANDEIAGRKMSQIVVKCRNSRPLPAVPFWISPILRHSFTFFRNENAEFTKAL